MTELFLKVIYMSISASWIILAVLLLRFILKKAPKWIHVLLWSIVAVRLLCPFTIESPFSVFPQSFSRGEIVSEWMNYSVGEIDKIYDNSIYYDAAVADRKSISTDRDDDYAMTIHERSEEFSTLKNTMIAVLMIVWSLGIFLILFYTVISYWHLYQKIETAVWYQDNIFQSEHVRTPFVFGIIRPRIYLPFKMDKQDMTYVIAHERAHIHRKDHWWKPLGFFLLIFHWFNPLMWLAYVLLCKDIELSCDEKVIKKLNNEQRADYTQTLLSCSVNSHIITPCPLAFGEVSVKGRVKAVMNYKKPTFWVLMISVITCVVAAACFLTNPKQDKFDIKIVVPAGSQENFVYSDEEISPIKNQIMISSGDALGDTEVVLKPIQVREKNAYEPTYLTQGMPVKMNVEKGAWFQIGINIQNATNQDIVVYVSVENIEVRIASNDLDKLEASHTKAYANNKSNITVATLDDAISKAILDYTLDDVMKGLIHVESHYIAYTEEKDNKIIVYLQAYESSYCGYRGKLYEESCSAIPTAITFSRNEFGEYILEEYWIPQDGSYYLPNLQNKFPQEAWDAFDSAQEEIKKLEQECYDKAMEQLKHIGGLEVRIADLIEKIQSSPATSSNPHDYIKAHNAEYEELLGYEEYSLHYCFSEFLLANQTDLHGKIMEEICNGILCNWGFEREEVLYKTGQDWFDAFKKNTENLSEQYSEEDIEKNYPASWILLEMLKK